jgi:hypothetical protein
LSILAGAGVLRYHDNTKLILIAGLAAALVAATAVIFLFGPQVTTATDD